MARKPLTRPRKRASQDRSRATVDALIEATARILVRDGFDRASTNRIAAEAGVSVGSLYQYYPCKEALVVAVIERHQREIMEVVRGAMAEVASQPIQKAVRRLVAAGIAAHRIDPKLHRVLAEEMPRSVRLENVVASSREAIPYFRDFLEGHRAELRQVDVDLAAFVCLSSIEALTHNAVLHRADMLAGEAAEAFVDEAARLLLGYLQQSR